MEAPIRPLDEAFIRGIMSVPTVIDSIVTINIDYNLLDGFHRVTAFKRLGFKTIVVKVAQ